MSWYQLLATLRDQSAEYEAEVASPPQACPNDGTPLVVGGQMGTLYCPFDGWAYPRDYDRPERP